MKKLNKKGFTLIELLAVIVILAILVTVSVPAVTKYLGTARKGTFADNAHVAISAVRNDVISEGITTSGSYSLSEVNELLEKKLTKSPFGNNYNSASFVYVTFTNDVAIYSICLTDGQNMIYQYEENVADTTVTTTSPTCPATPAAPAGSPS